MSADPPHHAVEAHADPGLAYDGTQSPGRRRFVIAVIVLISFITFAAAAMIYLRSASISEPTAAIWLNGNESLEGVQVIVSSPDHLNVVVKLSRENDYKTPVLLHPGSYTITVVREGDVLQRQDFEVERHKGVIFDLTRIAETPPDDGSGE